MAKNMQARQLIKQVPPVLAAINYEGTDEIVIDPDYVTSGWEVITPASGNTLYLVWRGFIDLAGYTQDELTFFTQAVDVQHGAVDISSANVLSTITMDLVTTRRPTNDECDLQIGFLTLGGTSADGDSMDLQQIVYGEWANKIPYSATFPSLTTVQGDTFGIGNPTATDRLYITRIVFPTATTDGSLQIGGTNFVIGGVTAQEKDLVYIERLRRAYTQDAGRNV